MFGLKDDEVFGDGMPTVHPSIRSSAEAFEAHAKFLAN
jgi:hypothetical protein